MKARFKLAVILVALCAGLLVPRALTAAAGSSGPRRCPRRRRRCWTGEPILAISTSCCASARCEC